jgi:hypothetical protein
MALLGHSNTVSHKYDNHHHLLIRNAPHLLWLRIQSFSCWNLSTENVCLLNGTTSVADQAGNNVLIHRDPVGSHRRQDRFRKLQPVSQIFNRGTLLCVGVLISI